MFYQATTAGTDPLAQQTSIANTDPGMSRYLGAIADSAIERNPIPSLMRMGEDYFLNQGNQISPDELNKQYGIEGRLKFDRSMTDELAKSIYQRKINEIEQQDIIRRGGEGIFRQGAGLVTGFATTFVDPLNIGLAFIPALGEAKLAQGIGVTMNTIRGRALAGALAGGAQASIAEIPIWYQARQEYADYELSDSLMNVAFGVGAGGTIGALGGAFAKWQGTLDNESLATLKRAAIGQIEETGSVKLDDVFSLDDRVVAKELSLGRKMTNDERLDFITQERNNSISEAYLKGEVPKGYEDLLSDQALTRDARIIQQQSDLGLRNLAESEGIKIPTVNDLIQKVDQVTNDVTAGLEIARADLGQTKFNEQYKNQKVGIEKRLSESQINQSLQNIQLILDDIEKNKYLSKQEKGELYAPFKTFLEEVETFLKRKKQSPFSEGFEQTLIDKIKEKIDANFSERNLSNLDEIKANLREERFKNLIEQEAQYFSRKVPKEAIETEKANRLKELSNEKIKQIQDDSMLIDRTIEKNVKQLQSEPKNISSPDATIKEVGDYSEKLIDDITIDNKLFTELPEGKALLDEIQASKVTLENQRKGILAMTDCFLKNIF